VNVVRGHSSAVLILISFLVICTSTQAQQPGKIFRIGYLDASNASGSAVLVGAFRQEMRKLGWIEAKNFTIEYRFAEGKADRLPELAGELVRLEVDLILATGATPAVAAKSATTSIPIVVTNVSDPVREGLVTSLARPEGNVTGFSSLAAGLNTKRLEILKDAVPNLTRVGVLWLSGAGIAQDLQVKEIRSAAAALKLKLEEVETQADPKRLESAFQITKQKQVSAIITTSSRPFFAERKRIVEFAGKHRLPAIYPQKEFVDEGGLMFYGIDYIDLFRRSAYYVNKLLKGANPADLPIEQPKKFDFVINLKTAKQIGLIIPPNVLARADRVIR